MIKRILTVLGGLLSAILLVFAGTKASRATRRAKEAEAKSTALLHDRTKDNLEKAAKFQASAAKHKEKAALAAKEVEAHLEKLGGQNETINDIATRFNNKRVRRKSGKGT